jgi:hypothetical protein
LIVICLFRFDLALAKSNDIFNIKVLKQTEDSVLFEISYYYSGDHGDNAKLTAWPKPPGFWGSSIIPLVTGDHTSQLNVKLMPKAPKEFLSDSVEFFYYAESGPPFYTKTFTFKKKWINSTGKPVTSPKQVEKQ